MTTNHPKEQQWIAPKTHPHKFPDKITLITLANIKISKQLPLQEEFFVNCHQKKISKT